MTLLAWLPEAGAGELSPHTRTAIPWVEKAPLKPEIVMEAGNRALSPDRREVLELDSLGLLSTGPDEARHPLRPFRATSAATAAAARLAARLTAAHPDFWPETVRGLMIHSAEWTDVMRGALDARPGARDRTRLLKLFGYGVPSFERASASARNHVTLISQTSIQPFAGTNAFQDSHVYALPWPRTALEALGEELVELKIVLSYFVEPSPGRFASVDPYAYQSHGLRFDLRRRGESRPTFLARVNAMNREGRFTAQEDDGRWLFEKKNAAGSLHCNVWRGPAADLLTRDLICVYPVTGWWRRRANTATARQSTRYALIASLRSADVAVDLHTPIQLAIEQGIELEVPV